MTTSPGRRHARREWLKVGFCVILLGYFLTLVVISVSSDVQYSIPQWLLCGGLVACSVALLVWQSRKAYLTGAKRRKARHVPDE